MRRIQTALLLLTLTSLIVMATVRAGAADLSLIGYDDRGRQETQAGQQTQPCQSCPSGTECTSCAANGACHCDADNHACPTAGPMILTIGPPPRLYSPSADFGVRAAQTPCSCTIVGDENAAAAAHAPQTLKVNPVCALGYSMGQDPETVGHLLQNGTLGLFGFETQRPGQMVTAAPPLPPSIITAPPFMPNMIYQPCAPVAYMPPAPMYFTSTTNNTQPICSEADRLDHMLQAIQHLEAAGMKAEADQLRCECDAIVHEVAVQLKAAETNEVQSPHADAEKCRTARENLPQHPVVTAALPTPGSAVHWYPVRQAGYLSPADVSNDSAGEITDRPMPTPFVPQPMVIDPNFLEPIHFVPPSEMGELNPVPLESDHPIDWNSNTPWWHGFRE